MTPQHADTVVDHRCSLEALEHALEVLDHKLALLDLDGPITLRAIGGFALMKYGIRAAERAFTVDIDTVTRDFSPEVTAIIREVADELNLETDWINNHSVIDEDSLEFVESMYQARWVPDIHQVRYQHITLQLADVSTLTRAKIIAADSAAFSGRSQDLPDLFELLRYQDIESYSQFIERYPDPYEEYPDAHDAVRAHLAGH